jgi:hypothetical protein
MKFACSATHTMRIIFFNEQAHQGPNVKVNTFTSATTKSTKIGCILDNVSEMWHIGRPDMWYDMPRHLWPHFRQGIPASQCSSSTRLVP